MTSTVAIPQFINYPGPLHRSAPTSYPSATVPLNAAYNHSHLPVTTTNGVPTLTNLPGTAMQVPIVPVGGGYYNDGMEIVWHGEFSRLFSNFYPPHVWYLTITNQAPQTKWKFHRDSAKVRFCCQDCGNGWTSMKGRVTFWFHMDFDNNAGFVQFKLYGQQCKKCNSGKFEYVMWYPEEVSKVMCNVYNKVGQTYYGFHQPPIRIDRRPGRPRNQHNSDLCQACRDGECDQARPIKPIFNMPGLVPSPLPISASQTVVSSSNAPIQSAVNNPSQSPVTNSLIHNPPIHPQSINSLVSSTQNLTLVNPSSQGSSCALAKNTQACPPPPPPPPHVNNSPTLIMPVNNGNVPVTLTSCVQPILSYTLISTTPKAASLTNNSNHFVPNVPPPAINGHYFYHSTPPHFLNGALSVHPPKLFSIVGPQKHLSRKENKPIIQTLPAVGLTSTENITNRNISLKEEDVAKKSDITQKNKEPFSEDRDVLKSAEEKEKVKFDPAMMNAGKVMVK